MLFSQAPGASASTAPTGPRAGAPALERHGSTGAGLPTWAPQRQVQQRAPTEDNSDSDDDGSKMGDEISGFSPIPRNLLATICVFGADGNLATKKILPTLFQTWKRKLMPHDVLIFGYARGEMDTEQFRKIVFRCIYNPTQPQAERKGRRQPTTEECAARHVPARRSADPTPPLIRRHH
jgi:hypothetical protein